MAGADVSNTVVSIIAAFTSCRDLFQRFRQKHSQQRNGKTKTPATNHDRQQSQELELSKSLNRGTVEIEEEYTRGFRALGESFAAGDAEAQHVLTKTLVRLNAGLVEIISAFLTNRNNNNTAKLPIDYGALASLSDSSRIEARSSLHNLHQRLLLQQSRLALVSPCATCHAHCAPACSATQCAATAARSSAKPGARPTGPPKQSTARGIKTTGGRVAYVSVKDSKQKKLALIRPRPAEARRTASSSSAGSSLSSTSASSTNVSAVSASTALTTPDSSPCNSPQLGSGKRERPVQHAPGRGPVVVAGGPRHVHAHAGSKHPPHPTVTPTQHPPKPLATTSMKTLSAIPPPVPHPSTRPREYPPPAPSPQLLSYLHLPEKPPLYTPIPPAPTPTTAPPPPPTTQRTPLNRARPDSFYSTTTASTKLGEIPPHRQLHPPDFAEMDRLNREAERRGFEGVPGLREAVERNGQRERRKGLWARVFK